MPPASPRHAVHPVAAGLSADKEPADTSDVTIAQGISRSVRKRSKASKKASSVGW
jgi:hypothetical protein